jgi:hypothetical protein
MSQAKEVRAYISVRTERWGAGVVSPVVSLALEVFVQS